MSWSQGRSAARREAGSRRVLDGSVKSLGSILGERQSQWKDLIRGRISPHPHVLKSTLVAVKRTDF